jgi:hypothetical protein
MATSTLDEPISRRTLVRPIGEVPTHNIRIRFEWSCVQPKLRNILAHGSVNLWPNAMGTFLVMRAALEALYTGAKEPN